MTTKASENTYTIHEKAIDTAIAQFMDLEFKLPENHQLELNRCVEELNRTNPLEIEAMIKQCMTFLESAERGNQYLNEHRNVFSRIWGSITGGHNHKRLQSSQDVINAQKACLQIINEMGKRMLIQSHTLLHLQNLMQYSFKKMRLNSGRD